jgi:acyl dehydratase
MTWTQGAFEDIEVGMTLATRARTVTEADVGSFANLTWDVHPIHTDAVAAAAGPFRERVAHGMLVVSFAMGLLPLGDAPLLALRRLRDVTFKRPVPVGETIAVELTVTGLEPVDERTGLVDLRLVVVDPRRRALVRARLEALWARREAPDQAPVEEPLCI